MMIINNKYEIGQTVYLVTDDEQKARLVTNIKVCPNDSLIYQVSLGSTSSEHYEFELSEEKNLVNAL